MSMHELMPPTYSRDVKSRSTLRRQGTRPGKRQRAEAKARLAEDGSAGSNTCPAGSSNDPPMLPLERIAQRRNEDPIGTAWTAPAEVQEDKVTATVDDARSLQLEAANCATSSTNLGSREQELMQQKQDETLAVQQSEGDQTMAATANSEAPLAPNVMSAPTAICTTSSTSLGGRGQKLMQPKQEETREVHQPEGDQTMPGAADSEAPPAPDIMRMPCGSACPTESEVSGWENLPEEAMVRAATLHTTSSCQRAPPSGVKGPAESTEDTSSEELLPDTDMWQRQPPVPPLPRRLRAAEHTQSGATSSHVPLVRRSSAPDTSSSPELCAEATTSSGESGVSTDHKTGVAIRRMGELRAKLMTALTKRAKEACSQVLLLSCCNGHWPSPPQYARISPELVCQVAERCHPPLSYDCRSSHAGTQQQQGRKHNNMHALICAQACNTSSAGSQKPVMTSVLGTSDDPTCYTSPPGDWQTLPGSIESNHPRLDASPQGACLLEMRKTISLSIVVGISVLLLCGCSQLHWCGSTTCQSLRPDTIPRVTNRAELGPKPQHRESKYCHLLFAVLLLLNHSSHAEAAGTGPGKPRVVIDPASMMGASHSLPTEHSTIEAKTSGEGHQRQGTAIRKIAFRRATSRANRAGIAQYRGRTMRAAQYNHLPQSPNTNTASGHARPMRHPPLGVIVSPPDIVMVQETHWLGEQDYSNDAWHVLATGCDRQHSGLLIMLAKAAFPAVVIRKEVAIPGRVLAVRIQQDQKVLNLVNVYQKVWNGTHEAKQIRTQVLDALQKHVRQAPSRYPLIVAGDFNASLDHRSPCVGSAVISGSHAAGLPDVDRLHGLLKQFDLRALNTFNPQPNKHTFTSYDDRKSQIDYIFVRARSADAAAKAPQVLHETRLAQWKTGSVHHPIIANIPHRFWHSSSRTAQLRGNQARAPTGRLAPDADKNGFLMTVDSALRQMSVWDTKAINATLAAAAEQFLVTNRPPRSTRPATAEQPVKHMWNMYRQLQAAKRAGANSEVLAEHHTAFKQAQRTVRDFSKNKRLQFLEDQLKAAAAASDRGDIRTLHVIINKVAPKTRRPRPQIRNEEGKMVSPTCELKLIKDDFWQQIYTSNFPIELNEPGTLALDADSFAQALAKLPSYKSLPGQYAPSIVWKLASRPIADLLQRTIFEAWQRDSIKVPQEWRDAWLALILKPSKSGKHPSDYRPIGLTDPIGKTVLGTLHLPQFAYIRHRGTAQAIARAFEHVHHAHALLMEQKLTLSGRKAGAKPEQLTGAITVSIDLSKAFDSLEPVIMQRALDHSALPQSVKELILQWHHGLSYHLQHERLTGSVQCQRGIRQGCRIAPSIWALFTALAMQEIDAEWCKQHSTWYADDTLFQAIFHNEHQLRQTLAAIAKALCVLKALGMTISTSKCAVLLELRGTKAKKAKAQVLTQHQQRLHLVVEHAGTQWKLPVVSKLDYLGAVLSYHKPKDATVDRRLQASRAAFERLRPVLTKREPPTSDKGQSLGDMCCLYHGV